MTADSQLDVLLRQRGRFKGFLASRLGGESDAEDVLQDGLIKAAQRIGELREEERVTAWFFTVLRHAMVDYVRSRSAARRRELTWLEDAERGTDTEADRQVCACFEFLLQEMKPREAALLRRVELSGDSVAKAAADLGMSANNASVTLHRARRELRRKLERFCGDCAKGSCLDCDCD